MSTGASWTAKEVALLRKLSAQGIGPTSMMNQFPGRSLSAVRSRLDMLRRGRTGVISGEIGPDGRVQKGASFTAAEDEILTTALRDGTPLREVRLLLPQRSYGSIGGRMKKLRDMGAECAAASRRTGRPAIEPMLRIEKIDEAERTRAEQGSAALRDRVRKYLGLRPWDREAA